MALGLTQPLTEMSTRNVFWGEEGGKGGRCVGLSTLPPIHVPIVLKSGSLNLLEPLGPVHACNGIALPFTMLIRPWDFVTIIFAYSENRPTVLKSGSLNLLEPSGPVQACNGIALPFTL